MKTHVIKFSSLVNGITLTLVLAMAVALFASSATGAQEVELPPDDVSLEATRIKGHYLTDELGNIDRFLFVDNLPQNHSQWSYLVIDTLGNCDPLSNYDEDQAAAYTEGDLITLGDQAEAGQINLSEKELCFKIKVTQSDGQVVPLYRKSQTKAQNPPGRPISLKAETTSNQATKTPDQELKEVLVADLQFIEGEDFQYLIDSDTCDQTTVFNQENITNALEINESNKDTNICFLAQVDEGNYYHDYNAKTGQKEWINPRNLIFAGLVLLAVVAIFGLFKKDNKKTPKITKPDDKKEKKETKPTKEKAPTKTKTTKKKTKR